MKVHTTNYYNTLIEVAEDCPTAEGITPPSKGDDKSIANLQFDIISQNPYKYTSDEVLFECFAIKKGFTESEIPAEKTLFFSKGQPCFRASPLGKRYGWGVHSNEEGKIAVFGVETEAYEKIQTNENIKKTKAMRAKKI